MSNPAHFVRFAKAVSVLAEYYSRELSEAVIGLYWQGLQQYPIDDIEAAIGRHLQNPDSGQYMPKIADIVRMIDGTTQSASAIAWGKVQRAIGSVGTYSSICFDDPCIHLALGDIGGWIEVGKCSLDELPFMQARFDKAYRAYRTRANDLPPYPRHLPGICETSNAAAGYRVDPPLLVGDKARARAVLAGGSDAPRLPVHVGSAALNGVELRLIKKEVA